MMFGEKKLVPPVEGIVEGFEFLVQQVFFEKAFPGARPAWPWRMI